MLNNTRPKEPNARTLVYTTRMSAAVNHWREHIGIHSVSSLCVCLPVGSMLLPDLHDRMTGHGLLGQVTVLIVGMLLAIAAMAITFLLSFSITSRRHTPGDMRSMVDNDRHKELKKWHPFATRLALISSIGATVGAALAALTVIYMGYQDPERMLTALLENSPAPLVVATIGVMIGSALTGVVCYTVLYFGILRFQPEQGQQNAGLDDISAPQMPTETAEPEKRQFTLETLSNVQASLSNTLLQFLQDKEARTLPGFDKDCLCVQSACRDTALLLNELVNDNGDVDLSRTVRFAVTMASHMEHLDPANDKNKQYGKDQRMLQAFQCMFTALQQHDFYHLHNRPLHLPLTRQFEIHGVAPGFHEALHGQ